MPIKDILKPLINSCEHYPELNMACTAFIAEPNSRNFAEIEACCDKILSTMKELSPEYIKFETIVLDAIKSLYQSNLCREQMVNHVAPKGRDAGLRAPQEVVITSRYLRKIVAQEIMKDLAMLKINLKTIQGCPQNRLQGYDADNVIVLADLAINKFLYADYEEKSKNSFTYCKQVLEEICKKFSSPEKDTVMGTNFELLMYGDIRYLFAAFMTALESIAKWVNPCVKDASYKTASLYQPRFFTLEFASHQALREFRGATAVVEEQYALIPMTV